MYVKVMNKESGMPQVLTKKSWDKRNQNNPKQAEKLEYLHDCDENGNSVGEEQTLQLLPNLEDRMNKASELLNEKQLKEAKLEIDEALKIKPDSETAKELSDKIDAEIFDAEREAEAKKLSDKIDSLLTKAKIAQEKKKYSRAKEFVEHALGLNPEHEEAKAMLDNLNKLIEDGKKD